MTKAVAEVNHIDLVQQTLGAQHAMHGLFWDILKGVARKNNMSEMEYLIDWGDEHPTTLIKTIVAMTPSLMPTAGHQGRVELHVHHELRPTALDIEGEAEEKEVDQG